MPTYLQQLIDFFSNPKPDPNAPKVQPTIGADPKPSWAHRIEDMVDNLGLNDQRAMDDPNLNPALRMVKGFQDMADKASPAINAAQVGQAITTFPRGMTGYHGTSKPGYLEQARIDAPDAPANYYKRYFNVAEEPRWAENFTRGKWRDNFAGMPKTDMEAAARGGRPTITAVDLSGKRVADLRENAPDIEDMKLILNQGERNEMPGLAGISAALSNLIRRPQDRTRQMEALGRTEHLVNQSPDLLRQLQLDGVRYLDGNVDAPAVALHNVENLKTPQGVGLTEDIFGGPYETSKDAPRISDMGAYVAKEMARRMAAGENIGIKNPKTWENLLVKLNEDLVSARGQKMTQADFKLLYDRAYQQLRRQYQSR